MSANMIPDYDESNPFVRLADSWYGLPQNPVDANSYADFGRALFLPDEELSDLSSQSYWNPDLTSNLSFLPWVDPNREVGYIRFNTGRPTMDAIATVVANSVGIDNLLRAKSGVTRGDWSEYFREVPIGIIEALSAGAGASSLLKGTANLVRRSAVPVVSRGGPTVYNWPSRPGYVPGGPGPSSPLAYSTARTGPRPITQIPSAISGWLGNVSRNATSRWNPAQPIRSTVRTAGAGVRGVGRNVRRYPGRYGAIAGLAVGAGAALADMFGGSPRQTATEIARDAERIQNGETGSVDRGTFQVVPRSGDATSQTNAATSQARVDIAGINQQYNNILRELQGMYQLSETEEEKERLRFMLADIEAQRDAGLQAVSEGYAQTVSQIQEQARISGERTAERSQRYGAELEASADRAAQRMMLQNLQQQQAFRGLGSGSQAPVNEWVGLMSAMAPAQQLYTQRMGDISREGMEWLAQTVGAQGQAQSADLQRLAAATRSGAIARQQAEVGERINRERELQRAAILDTMQRQASALQSAQQFNASPSNQVSQIDRANTISSLIGQGYEPEEARQYFEASGLGTWDPSEEALAQAAARAARRTVTP